MASWRGAVQSIEQYLRTLKSALGERMGVRIDVKHPILTWLCEPTGYVLIRLEVSAEYVTQAVVLALVQESGRDQESIMREWGRRFLPSCKRFIDRMEAEAGLRIQFSKFFLVFRRLLEGFEIRNTGGLAELKGYVAREIGMELDVYRVQRAQGHITPEEFLWRMQVLTSLTTMYER